MTAELSSIAEARDQRNAEATRQAASEQRLRTAFATAMQGDLTKPATLTQTGAQVLFEAIDCAQFRERAMVILAAAAAGRGTQRDAQQLLEEAGAHWAFMEAS